MINVVATTTSNLISWDRSPQAWITSQTHVRHQGAFRHGLGHASSEEGGLALC